MIPRRATAGRRLGVRPDRPRRPRDWSSVALGLGSRVGTPVSKFFDFNTMTMEELQRFEIPLFFTMQHITQIHAIALWFDCTFPGSTREVVLATSPVEVEAGAYGNPATARARRGPPRHAACARSEGRAGGVLA
mgnify:CR=1 FL=1